MNKWWFPVVTALAVLQGCASVPRGNIPVVDSSSRVSNSERIPQRNTAAATPNTGTARAQSLPEDSGVTVMIPQGAGAAPIQSFPAGSAAAPIDTTPISTAPVNNTPITTDPNPVADEPFDIAAMSGTATTTTAPRASTPNGIPQNNRSSGLSADEELDGPVLALLTTAQQQQVSGDFNGASSSLERAQRIAPREPQVLFRLAQVRLSQGDAAQAEQLARRALTYANGRPSLQAELWNTVAQAREKQGDSAGAAQARQKAKVSL